MVLTAGTLTSTALSAAALTVALTRPTAPAGRTYTATEQSQAAARLCERYRLASNAVNIETNGSDVALARISATNGAVMLEMAAADPALDGRFRDAALALAHTYTDLTALSTGHGPDNPEFKAVVSDTDTKTDALRSLCDE